MHENSSILMGKRGERVVILMKQSESFNHKVKDMEILLVIPSDLQEMRSEDSLFLPLKLWDSCCNSIVYVSPS